MIETKSATTERTVRAVPPSDAGPLPSYDPRVSIRPERLEFTASRDDDETEPGLRWYVHIRGTRIRTNGELGTQQWSRGFSRTGVTRGEQLPEWLAPWVDEQLAAFADLLGIGGA